MLIGGNDGGDDHRGEQPHDQYHSDIHARSPLSPLASAFFFSRRMMGSHSLKAMMMGTPTPMMDMHRQFTNSFFAASYSSLYTMSPPLVQIEAIIQ